MLLKKIAKAVNATGHDQALAFLPRARDIGSNLHRVVGFVVHGKLTVALINTAYKHSNRRFQIMARLIKLHVENFKRISVVDFSPSGPMTIIGGMNEQGKSSLLDAITVLLQGKLAKIPEPVRTGAKKATIEGYIQADEWDAFEDLHIIRNISAAGGWTIKVESKDGREHKSPETMLKKIFGEAVDPLAFIRMPPADRLQFLKKLVGLDFAELDARRKSLYDDRTFKGRELKTIEGALTDMEVYPDAPSEVVSVSGLMAELEKRKRMNRDIEYQKTRIKNSSEEETGLTYKIEDLQERLAVAQKALEKKSAEIADLKGFLEEMTPADESDIESQITGSESINAQIRANKQYSLKEIEAKTKKDEYTALTSQIETIDNQKSKELAGAKFPVEGLSFDESQVLYNNLPFDEKQLSSEELLRVSFSMAIVAQPTLKNILIREGSLLDENNLKLIGEMAEAAGIGVFVEVVGDDPGKATLIIENGRIKEPHPVEQIEQIEQDEFSDI